MTASNSKSKGKRTAQAGDPRAVTISLTPTEAGYVRLLSAVLQESEEEVVTDLLLGRFRPGSR